jgi:hypothetical protein
LGRQALRLCASAVITALPVFSATFTGGTFNFAPPPQPGVSNFTLASPATTSAGVYSNGYLIRTLWSALPLGAGTHAITWDGLTDDGDAVSPGTYTARVLIHNTTYRWLGTLGNSSSDLGQSTNIFKAHFFTHEMVAVDGKIWEAAGYNEGQRILRYWHDNDPGKLYSHGQRLRGDTAFTSVASDGTNIFYGSSGSTQGGEDGTLGNFIIAVNKDTLAEKTFSAGAARGAWASAFDYTQTTADIITGLAWQSNRLFVAHQPSNEIVVFNSDTGGYLTKFTQVASPRHVAAMSNLLAVIYVTNSTERRVALITNAVTGTPAVATNWATSEGVCVAFDPTDGLPVVVDAGTRHQVRKFDFTGAEVWAFGLNGGYLSNSPAVTSNKFAFWWTGLNGLPGFGWIAFLPDGKFWLCDPGNLRIQRWNAARTAVEAEVAYSPGDKTYCINADLNDGTRLFNGFLEYRFDPAKTFAPSNGSWELVRNWTPATNAAYTYKPGEHLGFKHIATLANGRTYGAIYDPNDGGFTLRMVELRTNFGLAFSDVLVGWEGTMQKDGAWHWQAGGSGLGSTWSVTRASLTNFDGNGFPQYDTSVSTMRGNVGATTLITKTKNASDPYWRDGAFNFNSGTRVGFQLIGGHLLQFHAGKEPSSTGYRLGTIDTNGLWVFRSLRPGNAVWADPAPFEQSNSETNIATTNLFLVNVNNYPGSMAWVQDSNIIAGNHGEYFSHSANGAQANRFHHFHTNGLFFGHLGLPSNGEINNHGIALAGAAGNSHTWQVVRNGAKLHVVHGDENTRGGPGVWEISGQDSASISNVTLIR